jgi:hypothetical protein
LAMSRSSRSSISSVASASFFMSKVRPRIALFQGSCCSQTINFTNSSRI